MIHTLLPLLALASAEPVEFKPSAERFADAATCRVHLEELVGEARGQDYVAVEGPYAIAEGDVRIHMVRAEGSGHRIREHRCLGAELGARDWPHGMGTGDAEEPFTIESVARKAEWLKQDGGER
ncbi:hypothetical protein [Allosphingosinicella sp.]|uniref:hypothetical protein n=1 Tax=Allosphingosinicella sp. TaxID=2823234 RepID=UPI002FC11E61